MLKIHLLNTRDNLLRECLTTVNTDAKDIKQYFAELLRLCKERSGVGLAANQVGLRENFLFLTAEAKVPSNSAGRYTAHICANPQWSAAPGSSVVKNKEGCLSLPGRAFEVPRHDIITAEWDNVVGHRIKKRLKGWPARVFQHEHDHLRGVLILDVGTEVI